MGKDWHIQNIDFFGAFWVAEIMAEGSIYLELSA